MQNAELTQLLVLIEERLRALEQAQNPGALSLVAQRLAAMDARLIALVPPDEIRKAMQDVLETLGLVGMLKEVHFNQRDQLAMLVGLAAQLLSEARHESKAGAEKRGETNDLLIQLRELGRKHVRGLADLERAQDWHETQAEQRGDEAKE